MAFGIGFDIGGTNVRAALVDLDRLSQAKSREVLKFSIRQMHSEQEIADRIADSVASIIEFHDVSREQIAHVGIAIAGQIAPNRRTIINAPNLGWRMIDFSTIVEESLDKIGVSQDVELVNDLNAIVWGEFIAGSLRGKRDVLAVYVGTGIGAGMIINGRLYDGASNVSGEIGHVKILGSTRQCGCGQVGCIEAIYGGKAIELTLLDDIANHRILPETLGLSEGEYPTAACLEESYKGEVPYAVDFWHRAARVLGNTIANMTTVLNPEAILLGGGVLANCPRLRSLVVESTREQLSVSALNGLELCFPNLGDIAGVIGAATLTASSLSE